METLESIVRDNPFKQWNWEYLSSNSSVRSEGFLRMFCHKLNWSSVTKRLPLNMIERTPDLPWQRDIVHSRVTPAYMEGYILRHGIPHAQSHWNWAVLSNQFPVDFIQSNLLEPVPWPWDFSVITQRCPIEFIETHPDFMWEWTSKSQVIDLAFVFRNKDYTWDWTVISRRALMSHVEQHRECPWDWKVLTQKASFHEIDAHPDWPWTIQSTFGVTFDPPFKGWDELVRRPNFTANTYFWDFVTRNVSLHVIESIPDRPWNWESLSQRSSYEETLRAFAVWVYSDFLYENLSIETFCTVT